MQRPSPHEARDVERSASAEALPGATEHERNDHEADRNIEPEDPLPGEALGDGATHDRSSDQSKWDDALKMHIRDFRYARYATEGAELSVGP